MARLTILERLPWWLNPLWWIGWISWWVLTVAQRDWMRDRAA